MQSFENRRKNISIVLIVLGIIIIVIMAINILGKGNETNNITNNVTQSTTNYTIIAEGNKVNTSLEFASDKKVGKILLEKSNIFFTNGTSKLTSKVTNDGIAKENLRFTVKFIANDGSIIAQSIGFVGAIKENETKYIDSYITSDVSNAKDITYEIIK
ncbi:MAG: hypothetical protein PHD15_02210 [Clostridia bacterium]|nr:hypothetical protein [Clostridia bacterium]MDD4386561.1 hypothetical protein [Clostridia bacterium]